MDFSVPEDTMKERMTTRLRSLLGSGRTVWAGPAYDGLTARVSCESGFDVISVGGYAVSATLGFPDVGLLTMSEALHAYRSCVRASTVPVVGDADTGFGNAVNVMRTVREFEESGLAGIQIEDQVSPKRCPFLGDNELIGLEEAVGKIRAAVAARQDPDFIIKARTDATTMDEAVTRGRAFAAAGADVVYGINKCFKSVGELRTFRREVGIPIGFSILGWTENLTRDEVDSIGGCLVGWPFVQVLTVAEALKRNMAALRENKPLGEMPSAMMPLRSFEELIGLPQIEEAQRLYLPAA